MRNSGAIRNAKYIFLGVSSIRIVVCLNISTELIVPIVFTYITLLGSNISVDHIYRNVGPGIEILCDQDNEIAKNKAYR